VIIDYIPWEDEDGKYRHLDIIIKEHRFRFNKSTAIYLWEILEKEIDQMVLDKNVKDRPEPSKWVEGYLSKLEEHGHFNQNQVPRTR